VLKTRIIPTLLYRRFGLVKGVQFDSRRAVGAAMQAIKVYNLRAVDELVFVDVTATTDDRRPDFDLIDDLADDCFMPLTVGGGIKELEDIERLLAVGADKVAIGTALVEEPLLAERASNRFGAQCVVAVIDARRAGANDVSAWIRSGSVDTGADPVDLAVEAARRGAGEILLQSIDRDGTMSGYDVDLVRSVCKAVDIPVIASGGAGTYAHMGEVLIDGGASAVAAASIFHFTEQTPREAREYLRSLGLPVRK
jgi:imidazole glycerol-phosphate synthase subunit HisF